MEKAKSKVLLDGRVKLIRPPVLKLSSPLRKKLLAKKIFVFGKTGSGPFHVMGVMASLQENKLWADYRWITASYSTSFLGLIAALKINAYELYKNMYQVFPFNYIDLSGSWWNFLRKGYIDPNSQGRTKFYRFIIRFGTGAKDDMTFQELYERFGTTLIFVITDYNNGTFYYLSRYYNPNMSLVEAAVVSSTIPSYHQPVSLSLPPFNIERYYVDGNASSSFPIHAFLRECSRFWIGNYIPSKESLSERDRSEREEDLPPEANEDTYMGIRYYGDLALTFGHTLGLSKFEFGKDIVPKEQNFILDTYDMIMTTTSNSQDNIMTDEIYGQTIMVNRLQPQVFPEENYPNSLPIFEEGMSYSEVYISNYEKLEGKFQTYSERIS